MQDPIVYMNSVSMINANPFLFSFSVSVLYFPLLFHISFLLSIPFYFKINELFRNPGTYFELLNISCSSEYFFQNHDGILNLRQFFEFLKVI